MDLDSFSYPTGFRAARTERLRLLTEQHGLVRLRDGDGHAKNGIVHFWLIRYGSNGLRIIMVVETILRSLAVADVSVAMQVGCWTGPAMPDSLPGALHMLLNASTTSVAASDEL